MVNKKMALMIGLLFATAAIKADYAVTETMTVSPEDQAAWVKFRSLSQSQQVAVLDILNLKKRLTITQAMRALEL